MKKTSIKKLLLTLALIIMITLFANTVNAESANPLNVQLPGTTNKTNTVNVTNATTNSTTNSTTNTTNITTNTAVSNYQNTNLPQTGDASDYVIFLFIAVCTVVAIYAYRKYKNYNI